MTTMNVSLPESLKAYVDRQVQSGEFGTSSAYVRELIRRDQERDRLRRSLLAGLESENAGPVDAAYWRKKRRRLKSSK
jgi:antitoxin ParD1/3/4